MSNLQIEINPQELHGIWRAGYALDFYSVSSGRRTEIGALIEQVKYYDDRNSIQPIAEIAAKFVKEVFAVDDQLVLFHIDDQPVLPHISAIIPIPLQRQIDLFNLYLKSPRKWEVS